MSIATAPVFVYDGCYRVTAGGAPYYALRDEERVYTVHPTLPNGLIDLGTAIGLSATLDGVQALADAHAEAHPLLPIR